MINIEKFYHENMEFEVPGSVYYPREDSLLMAKIIENANIHGSVLEIGCGSGFLSILLAKRDASVTAVDVNKEAIEASQLNCDTNNVEIKLFLSDLFEKVEGKFDVIVFNPPYLPVEEGETDETYAGGSTGRETIERFVLEVKKHLNPNGTVYLVISSLTGEAEVKKLFEKEGLTVETAAKEKVPWEELIIIKAFLNN